MIELLEPSLTKKVPAIEVSTQVPPIRSGSSIIFMAISPSKKIEPSTMVATTVTA